jgi:hypothetical protein
VKIGDKYNMHAFFSKKKRVYFGGVCSLIGASESAAAVWGAKIASSFYEELCCFKWCTFPFELA